MLLWFGAAVYKESWTELKKEKKRIALRFLFCIVQVCVVTKQFHPLLQIW